MNTLYKLQSRLISQATELFEIRSHDLPLEKEEFEYHFKCLGEIIYNIQKHKNMGDLIQALYKGEFEDIGFFDEDSVNELLKVILK